MAKIKRPDSFPDHVLIAWEACLANGGEYVIPFRTNTAAEAFRRELYAYRVAIEEPNPDLYFQVKPIKILLMECSQVELTKGYLDPERFPYALVMMNAEALYGEALRAAEEIN